MIADLMKKFLDIPQIVDEDYHSIKEDTPLVSMYTTGNVLVLGMLIPDEFLTEEIRVTNDIKEYTTVFVGVDVPMNQPQLVVSTQGMHTSTPRAHRTPTVSTASKKDDDDSEDRLEPGSHKENPKYVDDDDDEEKVDEEKDVDIGCEDVKATYDLIENNLKPSITATIIEDRDAFCSELPDLVYQEFNAQEPKIIEELFKNYVQRNVIQVHPTTTTSTETTSLADRQKQLYLKMKKVLKIKLMIQSCGSEKTQGFKSSKSARGSLSKHSAKDSTTYVSKKQQQQQQQHEWDAWVEETFIDDDEVIPEDETPDLIT
ncbi:hypothetical protein Tco_0497946 [Tanacetum coccineum]